MRPIGKMVDRVDASDCVKARVRKRERLCGVHNPKSSDLAQAALGCKQTCGRNCLFMNVNPDDGTAGGSCDTQRRASGSTRNIEQGLAGKKVKPAEELVLLVRGEPTILSNIFAKGFATDLFVQLRLEISVVGIVVTAANVLLGSS